jgi:ABC-type sulfate/molybdate transport systems ATPase subunit
VESLRVDIAVPRRSFRLDLALEVGRETLALVGPSGAGKTTVLRAIAGLVRPERGRIAVGSRPLFDTDRGVDLPPEERRVGFVFQEYALFPHLTVERNVAFGGRARVSELLERFRISHLAKARPGELSGGERQRVGLARALAREPEVLLLDEPLSALDAHTRDSVRLELQELLRELGLPALLVTHDFEDAAALADRVGVVVEGRLLQVGTPVELVEAPAAPFVASLTGGNLLPGRARPGPDGLTEVVLDGGASVYSTAPGSGRVGVVVQPWDVAVAREQPDDSALNHVRAAIGSLVPLGNRVRARVGPLTAELTAASAERLGLAPGEIVVASFKATATRLVPLQEHD